MILTLVDNEYIIIIIKILCAIKAVLETRALADVLIVNSVGLLYCMGARGSIVG
jgi:uncharacterized MnhB-related membrane protein